jgi:hypothetical protein
MLVHEQKFGKRGQGAENQVPSTELKIIKPESQTWFYSNSDNRH